MSLPKIIAAIVVTLLAAAGPASAALLGLSASSNFPLLTYNPGTTTYSTATGLLSITATPVAMIYSSSLPPKFFSSSVPRSVQIRVVIDSTGAVLDGVAGHDLVVTGEVPAPPAPPGTPTAPPFSGTLLTGEVVALGFLDVGNTTDQYDLRFRVTGGVLASYYVGRDIGVTVTSQQSTFTGLFTEDFAGEANGNIFPFFNADAGPDQTADEATTVVLDGTLSAGPSLTFSWTQIAGPAAELTGTTTATPSFVAPLLQGGFGSQTLTFQLAVSTGGATDTDTVNVTVKNLNHAPIAIGTGPARVQEEGAVTLVGVDSYDPDSDALTYAWEQTGGPPVALTGADSAQATFTAPRPPAGTTSVVLSFRLTVSDGALSGSAEVAVTVERLNHPPVASAGNAQTVNTGTLVTLDGSTSSDPDGDALTYQWTQVAGPAVSLGGATTTTPSFLAPGSAASLTFSLTVRDPELAASVPSQVMVTVVKPNDPPRCDRARANPDLLWPPNHTMVQVHVTHVKDPNDEAVTIRIDGVTQDEPVNGLGDGDTAPDAVFRDGKVLVRAERAGMGNGRKYVIRFTATDTNGAACTGAVGVGVPHAPKWPVVDDGQKYDSTQP